MQSHEIDRAFDAVSAAASQLRPVCTRAEIHLDHELIEARIRTLRLAVDELSRVNALGKYRQTA